MQIALWKRDFDPIGDAERYVEAYRVIVIGFNRSFSFHTDAEIATEPKPPDRANYFNLTVPSVRTSSAHGLRQT
jgi:hypothetical protein